MSEKSNNEETNVETALDRAIAFFDTPEKKATQHTLGEKIGCKHQSQISAWAVHLRGDEGGRPIPPRWCLKIQKAVNYTVTAEELNPKVFGSSDQQAA